MSNENADQTATVAAPATEAAPPQTTPPPSAPPAEPTQQEKAEKMAAIIDNKAGKEKTPKQPPKETPKPEEPPKAGPPKPPKRVDKLLNRLKESDTEIADLKAQLSEIAAREKEGKATELDQYKKSELEKKYVELVDAEAKEFHSKAADALGDKYEEFKTSNEYYAPLLNQYANDFTNAAMAMEDGIKVLNEFYTAFNDGSIDINQFVNLPVPRQLAILRKTDELMRNPQPPAPPAPPAASPPKVPIPTDSAVGSPSTDKKSKMDQIIANKAKSL